MRKNMSKRQEYLARMKQKLDKWSDEVDACEAKAQASMEVTRAKFQEQFSDLHAGRAEGERKLAAIAAAAEDDWEDLKLDTENVWDALEDSVYAFKANFQ